jgi:hypothetical protein
MERDIILELSLELEEDNRSNFRGQWELFQNPVRSNGGGLIGVEIAIEIEIPYLFKFDRDLDLDLDLDRSQ